MTTIPPPHGVARWSVRRLAQLPVRGYRLLLSPVLGPRCRFYPTCSAYALEALERHGALKGGILSVLRVLRCHPWWSGPMCDPVPERFAWRDPIRYKRRRQDRPGA